MPGRSYAGPLPPLSDGGRKLAERLRRHVAVLAKSERNSDLDTAAKYIEAAFGASESQYFDSGGRKVRNIQTKKSASIVVGAHYDTVPGSPGADDNASAVAVLIELAAMNLPVRFIAFANEEVPYFMGPEMGSFVSAKRSRERGENLRAMFSLEMLGYYRDAPGSQHYPAPLGFFYPDRGDFIAFVGDLGARDLVRKSVSLFRKHASFPSEGVAAPGIIPGVTWSDHWSFRSHGYPAIMVTDTAFYRYPHYHLPSDTPEKLDYERMARVTLGLAAMFGELANEAR
ncbi:MAG TPA: M28 family peptidase [Burkholderiales bacterium]|nr:M28 family peptidase [Burkholderiales bacterium]